MSSYVIYARKSTESEDRQVLSIDSQIRELRAIAAHNGVEVAEVLTESKSAKAPGRPVFNDLMRRVSRGQVRGVLAWKMDRLARNHLDTGQVLQALADTKLERVITSDRTYTPDGNDRFIGSFEFGMATKFIDDLRANTKRGIRERLNRGWASGLPPLGYLNDVAEKTIVRDPERFSLIRRMWDLLLDGSLRPDQILRVANEEWGFRTRKHKHLGGKPLSRSTLYAMLTNPFYAGIIQLRDGRVFAGKHDRMVSRSEFERAQAILGRAGRPRPAEHEFAFTGLIRCGGCGAGITAEQHVKSSGRYVYYHCTRMKRVNGRPCREPAITERALVGQLAQRLGTLAIAPNLLEYIRTEGEGRVRDERERIATVRESLERDLKALEREDEALLSLRLRELVSDEVFTQKHAELHARRIAAQEKLAGPVRSEQELTEMLITTLTFGQNVRRAFLAGPGARQRTILEGVGSGYTLTGREVTYSLEAPFDLVARTAVSESSTDSTKVGIGIFEPPAFGSTEVRTAPLGDRFGARLRIVDDVRKWILEKGGSFRLPDLDAKGPDLSLPHPLKAA